jgi:geranylgeranyl pyrophosphate synthase
MAFQIIDDIFDYESSIEELKKPVGNDIREGLCTLPLIYALQENGKEIRPLLSDIRTQPTLVENVLGLVLQTKAIERARSDAAHYTRLAHAETERILQAARHDLELIVNSLLVRTY